MSLESLEQRLADALASAVIRVLRQQLPAILAERFLAPEEVEPDTDAEAAEAE